MKNNCDENFLGLMDIQKNLRDLKFNVKAIILHIYNNNFVLNRKFKNIKKINYGSGTDIKEGFLNVDMNGLADIFLDVRNKSNIPSDSVELIYSSHFIEHLEHEALVSHLRESYRLLKKNSILRLGIPSFENLFKNYCNGNQEDVEKQREDLSRKLKIPEELICHMDAINRGVYEFGAHKICIDYQKIYNLLLFAGFEKENIKEVNFDANIDVESRKAYTFYVEAIK